MPVTMRKAGKKKIYEHWRSEKHIATYDALAKVQAAISEMEATVSALLPKAKRNDLNETCGRLNGLLETIISKNWEALDNAPIADGHRPWDSNEEEES